MSGNRSYLFSRAIKFCLAAALSITLAARNGSAQSVVEVGGEIESQEWTSDHIYHVTSHIVINTGVELIIRPGVIVKFRQGTGITVNGSFKVFGEDNGLIDTVFFQPLYTSPPFNWKWLGIHFSRVQVPNTNFIDHARIENASIGVNISGDSRHVLISNTLVQNSLLFGIVISASNEIVIDRCRVRANTGAGINIQNSSDCLITNNHISDNNDGIWLLASETGNRSTGNTILDNVIRNNTLTNIFLNSVDGGKCTGNLIENNFIESSFIGIQFGNPSSVGGRNNLIGNVIVTNKISGSGLIVYQDTALISHNIFWHNKDAIILNRAVDSEILNNSFFDNGYLNNGSCIIVNSGSANINIGYNTFTGNGNLLINLFEPTGPVISNNNFFKNRRTSGLIRNNSGATIPIGNNYWGTVDTSAIEQMLDGYFSYEPYLPVPDTAAPVSPPMPAYKQIVNNQVRISWRPNPETDLAGYRVHYGGFNYYNFNNFADAGADTTLVLDMIGIYDTIAVTAYDIHAGKGIIQSQGHESPFSFPVFFPYAGPDTTICKDQAEFFITQSTYSGDIINLNWSTSGDGNFSTNTELWTTYYPGTIDLESGSVELTLIVRVDFGVFYEDSFILSFLDIPIAYAGNDTILAANSSLFLHDAFAENFDTVYWTSLGNGVFDDPGLINPVYTPGMQDILNGNAQLVLHAISQCGSVTDTLNITIERRYILEGRVWKDNELLGNGVVIAILAETGNYKAERLAPVMENGVFRFNDLIVGNYLLYAVPDTLLYPETLPGYYAHKRHWEEAYLLDLHANTFDLDLYLQTRKHPLPSGVGSISGHFLAPAENILAENIYCADWFSAAGSESVNCQGGVSNATILLFNKAGSKILAHNLTDASGNFAFNQLPFGDYVIDAEKAGYLTTPSPVLTISPQSPVINNIIISIEPGLIKVAAGTLHKHYERIEVFPNPAADEINLGIDQDISGSFTVEVRNVYNQRLIFEQVNSTGINNQEVLKLSVGHLRAGVYFGTITTPATVRSFTFIKN
jgi:parallel beta-helix repeat protein